LAEDVALGVNELDLTEDVARLCTFYILISLNCRLERHVVWKMCNVPIYTVSHPRGRGLIHYRDIFYTMLSNAHACVWYYACLFVLVCLSS
jgi:hypothetical protein